MVALGAAVTSDVVGGLDWFHAGVAALALDGFLALHFINQIFKNTGHGLGQAESDFEEDLFVVGVVLVEAVGPDTSGVGVDFALFDGVPVADVVSVDEEGHQFFLRVVEAVVVQHLVRVGSPQFGAEECEVFGTLRGQGDVFQFV